MNISRTLRRTVMALVSAGAFAFGFVQSAKAADDVVTFTTGSSQQEFYDVSRNQILPCQGSASDPKPQNDQLIYVVTLNFYNNKGINAENLVKSVMFYNDAEHTGNDGSIFYTIPRSELVQLQNNCFGTLLLEAYIAAWEHHSLKEEQQSSPTKVRLMNEQVLNNPLQGCLLATFSNQSTSIVNLQTGLGFSMQEKKWAGNDWVQSQSKTVLSPSFTSISPLAIDKSNTGGQIYYATNGLNPRLVGIWYNPKSEQKISLSADTSVKAIECSGPYTSEIVTFSASEGGGAR